MTYSPAPVRPVMDDDRQNPSFCPVDKTALESGWSFCPDCGDDIDRMESDKSDFLCSCTNERMTRKRGDAPRNETHECGNCGAIWIGLDWCNEGEANRDPDKWDEVKAKAAFASYMKSYYGVEILVSA